MTSLATPVSPVATSAEPVAGAHIGTRGALVAAAAGALISVVTDARSSQPIMYIFGLAASLLTAAAVFVVPRRFVLLPLLVLMISTPDLTQSAVDVANAGVNPSATLWQLRVLGLSPAFTVFGLLCVVALRLPPAPVRRHEALLLAYLFIVAPGVALWYGYATSDISVFVTDAKLPMFFGVGIVCFRRFYHRYPEELRRTLTVVIAVVMGRYGVDLMYLLLGVMRTEISGVNRVSVDSAKGLLVVVIMFLVSHLTFGRRLRAAVVMPLALMLLLAYATRWLVLMLLVSLLVFAVAVGARRAVIGVSGAVVLVALGVAAAAWLRPEILDISQKRFQSLLQGGAGSVQAIDVTRVVSIANSMRLLWDRGGVLTGLGYGSWYTDDFLPFPPTEDLLGGFGQSGVENRRFYRVHDFAFHMTFKIGVVGLFLYLTAFWRPLRDLWRRRQLLRRNPAAWTMALMLWCSVPSVLTSMYWSGKGLLLSALLVAAADALACATAPGPELTAA